VHVGRLPVAAALALEVVESADEYPADADADAVTVEASIRAKAP
jgi:hypothetical protein